MKPNLLPILLTSLLSFLALLFTSCQTTIPEEDRTPPEIRLELEGVLRQEPGETPRRRTLVMTNPPQRNWNGSTSQMPYYDLLPDNRYRFRYSVVDGGGVAQAELRLSGDVTLSRVSGSRAFSWRRASSGDYEFLSRGLSTDPRTALVITGDFVTPDEDIELDASFVGQGADFGGEAGSSNERQILAFGTIGRYE